MLISLTVGKVDAGVAVLLTEDKRLIEFPSILLPPSISSGSIVDITVSRNHASEAASQADFAKLQSSIYSAYGEEEPEAPVIRCRNATQTSVVLEWDPINLATADLRSLALYKNGQKMGNIPRPREQLATKISGLSIDTEFTFHLVMRTSAGILSSEKLKVRTHKMTELSGITVTPGVLPAPLRESLSVAVERIGAKFIDTVRIDTTHFVCTEGRGREWEKAVEQNIPVVRPEWVEGCEREGRIVGVRGYYLNADPRLRQVGQGVGVQQAQQSQSPKPQSQSKETPRPEESRSPARDAGQSNDSEPPALPEKDVRPSPSRATSTQKIPSPQPSPNLQSEQDEDSDEESETEASEAESREPEQQLPIREAPSDSQEKAKDAADEDEGTFDDVKL